MISKKVHYKSFDLIRAICCLMILLYHLGLLKGGYLSVCTFFVLSGYLAVTSLSNKKEISLKKYYISRFKKIYLPLIIVTFISISVISFIPNIKWLNLKPETTSVLFGYNNYWQLNANLDYFVRHISSPFIHFWYIAILIQFEVLFPFIYLAIEKISKKTSKLISLLVLLLISIISSVFFYKLVKNGNVMYGYYSTFARLYSLMVGVFLGFLHKYYRPLIINNHKTISLLFNFYMIVLILFNIFIGVNSSFFGISMIVITLISMRLIDYCINYHIKTKKVINLLSILSYEIYLIQYPVIFIVQNINIPSFIRIILVFIITFVLSCIMHLSRQNKKYILKIFILILALFGFYKYIIAKDYTKDIKALENQLNENRELILKKQKEIKANREKENEEMNAVLSGLTTDEEKLKETVRNLRITGVGDSIMEMTVRDLYKVFPNSYFDGLINRTERQANNVLAELKSNNMLSDVVLLNVGTNGQCNQKCKDSIMETLGNRRVYWLNATNPDYPTFNPSLEEAAKRYSNIHIIDWVSVASAHPEYITHDGVHPSVKGCKAYAEVVFNYIYQDYLKEANKEKEQKIEEYAAKEKSKVTFIGNEVLLGIYNDLSNRFNNSDFITDKEYSYTSLKKNIDEKIKNDKYPSNLVFIIDKSIKIDDKELEKLLEDYEEYKIYIVNIFNNIKINNENINIIDFSNNLNSNKNYLSVDDIHLTDKGNKELVKVVLESLKID